MLGQMVGRYRIVECIGSGGMGAVYRAVHPEIGSHVAVKVLHAHLADTEEAVARFFAEAQAANAIRHEGIVNVLDTGELSSGEPYLLMEHLEGRSLADHIALRSPLSIAFVVDVLTQLLDALAAAHRVGLVHRDVKPHNVFITRGGRTKLLDFGVAKLLALDASATGDINLLLSQATTGGFVGTPEYLSPEQALSLPTDARSDIYSVGVVAYEALTGQRPFTAPRLHELLCLHLTAIPRAPRSLRADMPLALEGVVQRALAKKPADRFSSAHEMAHALGAAHAGSRPLGVRRGAALAVGGAFIVGAAALTTAWARGAFEPAASSHAHDAGSSSTALASAAPPPTPPNLERFDASAYLPDVLAWARLQHPKARLTMLGMYGVGLDGLVDFRNPPSKTVTYHLDYGISCGALSVNENGAYAFPKDFGECEDDPVPTPRCSVTTVVARAVAIQVKPPPPPLLVSYKILFRGDPTWTVRTTRSVLAELPDDCPPSAPP